MDYLGTIDGVPFEGGEGRDQLLELGSGRLIPGFEEQLTGATAGEERTVDVTSPDDCGAEHLAGRAASFAVTIQEVKAKVLPELDDDFAADSAGFDTLEELREDARSKLAEQEEAAIESEFREAVVDAAVAEATVEVPEPLVEARASEMWHRMAHTLSHQGIPKDAYLNMVQKTEEEVVAEARPEAEQALRREAVIAAIVEAERERLEPTEEELLEAVERSARAHAAQTGTEEKASPAKVLERLRGSGRIEALKQDLAASKAIDFLVQSAKPISVEQAQAKGKLWTPGDEESKASAEGLWTPGS
jgi:trigger factor